MSLAERLVAAQADRDHHRPQPGEPTAVAAAAPRRPTAVQDPFARLKRVVHSQLVAPGLTMIGGRAGCRHLDQVPSYLNNLFRLGMVWFSREALRDPLEYQVVEAQPDVLAAMHSVKFPKVVRRSIHLTPFGEDFCRTCLVDEEPDSDTSFPAHGVPPEEPDSGEPPSG